MKIKEKRTPTTKTKVINLSDEQKIVCQGINEEGCNIVMKSVAGSGKSTTTFGIAQSQPKKRILLLTYNKKLRAETISKVFNYQILNLEVHTYHSFFRTYIDGECETDKEIYLFFKNPLSRFPELYDLFDIVIFDEDQDMTPQLFQVVALILVCHPTLPQIGSFGDLRQSIYKYAGSDNRFLSMAPQILSASFLGFNEVDRPWKECVLQKSYRCSKPICSFINMCLKNEVMIAGKDDYHDKVKYFRADLYHDVEVTNVCMLIKESIDRVGVNETMVLCFSVLKSESVKRVANTFKRMYKHIQLYIPTGDSDTNEEENILENKLVFSTFHSTKGLERKSIFVLDFNRRSNERTETMSEEFYTGLSRPMQFLCLIDNYGRGGETHDFIDKRYVLDHCVTTCTEQWIQSQSKKSLKKEVDEDKKAKVSKTSVTSAIRCFNAEQIDNLFQHLPIRQIEKGLSRPIYIPPTIEYKVQDMTYFENVSEITGTAIPMMYSDLRSIQRENRKRKLSEEVDESEYDGSDSEYLPDSDCSSIVTEESCYKEGYSGSRCERSKTFSYHNLVTSSFIEASLASATDFCAKQSGFTHKQKQIESFNWLSVSSFCECYDVLDRLLGDYDDLEYEKCLQMPLLDGSLDAVSPSKNTIFEFKCVQKLKDEHIIQLAFYSALWLHNFGVVPTAFLCNILTGEVLELCCDERGLKKFMSDYEKFRMASKLVKTDAEFLEECRQTVDRVRRLVKEESHENVESDNLRNTCHGTNLQEQT